MGSEGRAVERCGCCVQGAGSAPAPALLLQPRGSVWIQPGISWAQAEIGSIPGTASSKAFLSHSCQPPAQGLDTAVCWKSLKNTWSAKGTRVALLPANGIQAPGSPGNAGMRQCCQPQGCAELQELPGMPRLGLSVQGQQSEPAVPTGPFQLRAFRDSVNSGKLPLWQAQLQRKQSPECCVDVPGQ